MRYELGKVLFNRVSFLLLAIVLANAALFYCSCFVDLGGYTYGDIRQEYRDLDAVEEQYNNLLGILGAAKDPGSVSDTLYQQLSLLKAVLNRVNAVEECTTHLQEILSENIAKLNIGLYPSGSFEEKVLQKSIASVISVQNSSPTISFSGGIEALIQHSVTDWMLMLFGVIACLLLVTTEQNAGVFQLLCPTKNGRLPIYFWKFSAMLLLVMGGAVFLYGGNVMVASSVLGLGDLSRPIQSVYGLELATARMSVAQWLLSFYGEKLLWTLTVSSIFFFFCCYSNQFPVLLLFAVATATLSLLMEKSGNPWIRALSISAMKKAESGYLDRFYLNFFGVPLRQAYVRIGLCFLIILDTLFLGGIVFCRMSKIPAKALSIRLPIASPGRHSSLFLHEGYKFLVAQRGIIILLSFIAMQSVIYGNPPVRLCEEEMYYRSYSQYLSGEKSSLKENFLIEETTRFSLLNTDLHRCLEATGGDTQLLHLLAGDTLLQLRKESAFERAKLQYDSLTDSQEYIYQTGYNCLFDKAGREQDLLNIAKLFLMLIFLFSGLFAHEKEQGMDLLVNSSAGKYRVIKCKLLWVAFILLITMIIAFLPRYLQIAEIYGLSQIQAQANSLLVFSTLPNCLKIRDILLLKNVIQLMLGIAATIVILTFSRKCRNTVLVIVLSITTLLLPIVTMIVVRT